MPRNPLIKALAAVAWAATLCGTPCQGEDQPGDNPLARRQNFVVGKHKAFVMIPQPATKPIRWVWYAPTLGNGLPGAAEKWMFQRLHAKGIAIAGIDVGESFGNAEGRRIYQEFYEELTKNRGFHDQPVLLARSRGGLMLYSWAVDHPKSVAGVAGIYPVCNLASYPGLARAAPAYGMSPEQLKATLPKHNPIDRLAPLAAAKVPVFHIHGDQDTTVPLEANSAELAKRYTSLGGPAHVEVVPGQGHNMWSGWFTSQTLTDFMITRALGQAWKPPVSTREP